MYRVLNEFVPLKKSRNVQLNYSFLFSFLILIIYRPKCSNKRSAEMKVRQVLIEKGNHGTVIFYCLLAD